MKKFVIFILAMMIAVMPMIGCNDTPSGTTGGSGNQETIELSQSNVSLGLFKETELTATYSGSKSLQWTNSNPNALQMTANGSKANIVAVNSGSSVVTVTDGSVSAQCTVSIASTTQTLALSVEVNKIDIRVGGSLSVPAKVLYGGEEFAQAIVSYVVADTEIASFEDGEIIGKKAGQTTLTVRATCYGHSSNVITIPVTVKSGPVLKLSTSNVELYKVAQSTEQYPNSKQLSVSIIDNGVHEVEFTAQVSDEDVISLNAGVITAKAVGDATVEIACTYNNVEYTAIVKVKVLPVPEVIVQLKEPTVTMFSPENGVDPYTHQLVATVTIAGNEVSADSVTWSVTEGATVVTVSNSGLVTTIGEGTAKVTASYVFAGETYTAVATVISKPNSAIYFGQLDSWKHDGIVADMKPNTVFVYENVDVTSSTASPIIRMQLIQTSEHVETGAYYHPKGARNVYITLQDSLDHSNYITVLLTTYKAYDGAYYFEGAKVGARVSTWGAHSTNSTATAFWGYRVDKSHLGALNTVDTYGGWWDGFYGFSFYNAWLGASNYTASMFGLALNGTTLYMHVNGEVHSLLDFADSTQIAGKEAWSGLTPNAKLNVFVTMTEYNGADSTLISIDTLGGEQVTKASLSGARMYEISGGALFPDAYKK